MSELFSSLPTLCLQLNTICIDEYGDVWSFGDNNKGKCGHDLKEIIIFPPKKINNLNNIQFIACGLNHTICCDYNGNVFSFGDNSEGQLGLNKTTKELPFSHIPQQINLPQIQQISSGSFFSVCLTFEGELWSFGQNSNSQLGIGNTKNSSKPIKINNLSNINYIMCGGYFCYCITTSNDYYSWGKNNYGQLSQENKNEISIPLPCKNIPDNILSIRGGSYHVLFLTSDGIVYSCGDNVSGQLGHGNNTHLSIPKQIISLPFIKKISCGYNHSLCIDIDNKLWSFGLNHFGQLGLDVSNSINIPTKLESLNDIIDISYRANSTIIKTSDNKIYAFGHNNKTQLGIETCDTRIKEPIQVLINKEDIWKTNIPNSRAKSARK